MEAVAKDQLPLIVILGPTASGKTGLAIRLAEKFGGEIICADSRTIYRGLDIGTAKPTIAEQRRVKHWGLDLVGPGERFTAADFKKYALDKINSIRARGKTPFLVGGTGLYIDGVLFDYNFKLGDSEFSSGKFEAMTINELHDYCYKNSIIMPENGKNKRYIINAIKNKGINTSRSTMPIANTLIVGITTPKSLLTKRIKCRTEQIFDDGIVKETKMMGKLYGRDSEPMTGNAYRIVHSFLDSDINIEESKTMLETLDWQLAKRQLTWFKRNPFISWHSLEDAETYIGELLAKRVGS